MSRDLKWKKKCEISLISRVTSLIYLVVRCITRTPLFRPSGAAVTRRDGVGEVGNFMLRLFRLDRKAVPLVLADVGNLAPTSEPTSRYRWRFNRNHWAQRLSWTPNPKIVRVAKGVRGALSHIVPDRSRDRVGKTRAFCASCRIRRPLNPVASIPKLLTQQACYYLS